MRASVTTPLRLAAYALSGVLVLAWIWRANANARALGAAGLRCTPAWAVGWFFVPLGNLLKPFDAMRKLWLASAHPQGWTQLAEPLLLRWWWVLLLLAGGSGFGVKFLSIQARSIGTVINATWLMALSDLAGLCSAGILVWVIAQVQSMQATQNAPLRPD